MLEIKKIKKQFGNKKVLKGISLQVEQGDIVGIIGPSGCGKSTFLRCINLLEKPSSGEIYFHDTLIQDDKNLPVIRRKIGMVFQQFNLFPNLTVLENIVLAPVQLKIMSESAAKKEARRLLKEIDLVDKESCYPSELSGGQKQRVAIIRTLIMKPEMILFDEPTSALDPEMIGEVTNLMRKIAEDGMTMMIVSHEMNFIKSFCTRVVFLHDGVIAEEGSSEDVFEHPQCDKLVTFLSKIKNI